MRLRLIMILAAGVLVAADNAQEESRSIQAPAIAAIKRWGGSVEVRAKDIDQSVVVSLPFLDLCHPSLWFNTLANESLLVTVNLFDAKVTDSMLEELVGLIEMRSPSRLVVRVQGPMDERSRLVGEPADPKVQPVVQDLCRASLREMYLTDNPITDAGLSHLARFTNLRSLGISGTQLRGVGLQHLKGIRSLQSLGLACPRLTDAGLVYLKGLNNLRELSLAGSRVTDAGLAHLKDMTRLEALFLSGTRITDAGLKHLHGLTGIRRLYLADTKVSDKGIQDLQKALPRVAVIR
jgi:hypothetical protein